MRAEVKGNTVVISFPYDPVKVDIMRKLTERKFDNLTKKWLIPYDLNSLVELSQVLNQKGITCDNLDTLIQNLQKESIIDIAPNLTGLKRNPYPHQIEAAKFLLEKKKAICGDEMGVGKTLSAIVAAMQVPGRKLIICPARRPGFFCCGSLFSPKFSVRRGEVRSFTGRRKRREKLHKEGFFCYAKTFCNSCIYSTSFGWYRNVRSLNRLRQCVRRRDKKIKCSLYTETLS